MSEPIVLILPCGPSVNHYLKNYHHTPQTQAFIEECKLIARLAVEKPLEGELVVIMDVPRKHKGHMRDIDSHFKTIFDALNKILWYDDSQIVELHCYVDPEGKDIELSVWQRKNTLYLLKRLS